MKRADIIDGFVKLGELFRLLSEDAEWPGFGSGLTEDEYASLHVLINKENIHNPWFTKESVQFALSSLAAMLERQTLENFAAAYPEAKTPKRVAIIMAGNIPLVSFHDFLCVLLSGHIAVCKLSSDDPRLLPAFISVLQHWQPEFTTIIECKPGPVKHMEAVIATGSDNSVTYFEQYFGQYPHIFRRNRTSVAVLTGNETPDELKGLGEDMFRFFGLGCRNVSRLFVPKGFELNRLFEAIISYGAIVNHHKYANNYDYNRTVFMMNQIPFLDNNFCILKEDDALFSPLSVFYYSFYERKQEVEEYLSAHSASIQAVVGRDYLPFGTAQCPTINDFADGIDTMKWLSEL